MPTSAQPAVLLLADGTLARGFAFGAIGTTTGEICFNTGMTGYQEVFTDPSYFGQILIMNTAHVGNYGVKESDVESDSVKINGLIGRNLEAQYSRKMADGSLDAYLKSNNVVSITGVETRALVEHIRQKGAMNCIISSETTDIETLKKQLGAVPDMDGLELAKLLVGWWPLEPLLPLWLGWLEPRSSCGHGLQYQPRKRLDRPMGLQI